MPYQRAEGTMQKYKLRMHCFTRHMQNVFNVHTKWMPFPPEFCVKCYLVVSLNSFMQLNKMVLVSMTKYFDYANLVLLSLRLKTMYNLDFRLKNHLRALASYACKNDTRRSPIQYSESLPVWTPLHSFVL